MRRLACLGLVLLMGCYNFQAGVSKLNIGDSKAKVEQVMGAPHDSQMNRGIEVWQYFGVVSFGMCDYRQMWFRDGRLFGVTSYRRACVGGCSPCISNIDWSNPPDHIIEVRQR